MQLCTIFYFSNFRDLPRAIVRIWRVNNFRYGTVRKQCKFKSFRIREIYVHLLILPSCITFGKLLYFSKPQFLHLKNSAFVIYEKFLAPKRHSAPEYLVLHKNEAPIKNKINRKNYKGIGTEISSKPCIQIPIWVRYQLSVIKLLENLIISSIIYTSISSHNSYFTKMTFKKKGNNKIYLHALFLKSFSESYFSYIR